MKTIGFLCLCLGFMVLPTLAQELVDFGPMIEKTKGQTSRFWLASGVPTTMQSWETYDASYLEGQVLEINDKELIYVPRGKEDPTRIVGDQVVAIEVAWGSKDAEESHRLFQQRKYEESLKLARKGLASGILKWQQRALVADMVECLRATNRLSTAGDIYSRLSKEHPPNFLLASIPLIWQKPSVDRSATEWADKWIADTDESLRLIAASWQLSGNKRDEAVRVLQDLSKSKNTSLQRLAQTQLWRTTPAMEAASQRLADWTQLRDSMPQPLQWGPTLLIADKLDQAGKTDLAIPEWIRFATLHQDRPLEVESCIQRAVAWCKSKGREEDAKRIESMKKGAMTNRSSLP